jgi:hypothetical protein
LILVFFRWVDAVLAAAFDMENMVVEAAVGDGIVKS